jgi:hypothetical protein
MGGAPGPVGRGSLAWSERRMEVYFSAANVESAPGVTLTAVQCFPVVQLRE